MKVDPSELQSGLYRGSVVHQRTAPKPHRFRVRFHFIYLDLDELSQVFAGRMLWSVEKRNVISFRRKDYFGDPDVPLAEAVRTRVADEIGREVSGPVRVLTHLRSFGIQFNPVSFYYCYAEDGTTLEAVLSEITNTPWNERHAYIVDLRDAPASGDLRHRSFDKTFHVSPFFELDHRYDWGFSDPGESLTVWMQNFREGRKVFDVRLEMTRRPITGGQLARALLRNPCVPLFGLAAIYWQAARLWWKRTPFFPHPDPGPEIAGPRSPGRPSAIDPDRGALP